MLSWKLASQSVLRLRVFFCNNINMDFSSVCSDAIIDPGDGEYQLDVSVDLPDNTIVLYWGANPPSYNTSFSGSGLPFPNPNVAFEDTPNKGAVRVVNGQFTVHLHFPNSFYVHMGAEHIPPRLYYSSCSDPSGEILFIDIENEVPSRRQELKDPTYPKVIHSSFELDTQERILRQDGYPLHN